MNMSGDVIRLANSVLWPGFLGRSAPAWLLAELRNGLAGVVYFAQNLGDGLDELSSSIHAANPNALIGIDEEGGSVTRLEVATGSTVPSSAQLGEIDDEDSTYRTAREIARRCAELGIDVVLGPVADVNTDPRNPVIGVRAFGGETALVSRHVAAAVRGIQDAGLAACAKHYPGHGDTHLDSHHALPRIELTSDELEAEHLPPFDSAIAAGVHSIMTAHIVVPEWGDEPATLNPRVLAGLRERGFDGVIVTDALDMAAVRETVGLGQGAVAALLAGADLLCVGNPTNPGEAAFSDQDERDFYAARDAIVDALQSGVLPRARVEEAAARVARMARAIAVRETPVDDGFDGLALARPGVTARGALTPHADVATTIVDARRRATLAVDNAGSFVARELAKGGEILRLDATSATAEQIEDIVMEALRVAADTIVLVDRLDDDSPQRAVVSSVRGALPDAVVVNVGLPGGDLGETPIIDARAASLVGARAARELFIGA